MVLTYSTIEENVDHIIFASICNAYLARRTYLAVVFRQPRLEIPNGRVLEENTATDGDSKILTESFRQDQTHQAVHANVGEG